MNAPRRLTDRKRLAILAAAAEEFRAFGFEATSMDRIAAKAEVSKRTVYNHFPSKEDLFAETLVQLFDEIAGRIELAYRPDVALRTQLLELMQQKMRMMADPNFLDVARVAIGEAIHFPERTRKVVARLGEREEGLMVWIRAAQADGRLKAGDPVFAAGVLQGQVKAAAFWPQVTMGMPPLTPEQQAPVVDAAVSMFLAYFAEAKQAA